ncbi:hypothetical protein [Nostoc sp. TCL240-02]|uniref:hypothetical protein n=1 Tax=Nostoc sp. TCL240-02 TaxID=2572090 RepID=UPI0020C60566|nr:hypothetical protein [Nostoc sp. TCL240-02]
MNSFLLTLPPHSFGIALKGLPVPAPLKENLLLAGQYSASIVKVTSAGDVNCLP